MCVWKCVYRGQIDKIGEMGFCKSRKGKVGWCQINFLPGAKAGGGVVSADEGGGRRLRGREMKIGRESRGKTGKHVG